MNNAQKVVLLFIIVIIGIVALLSITYVTNLDKTYSFDKFTMVVPGPAEFEKQETNYSSVNFIDRKNNIEVIYLETSSDATFSPSDFLNEMFTIKKTLTIDDVENNVTFYEIDSTNMPGFNYKYLAVYDENGLFIVVLSSDVEELENMVKTINVTSNNTEL